MYIINNDEFTVSIMPLVFRPVTVAATVVVASTIAVRLNLYITLN